jgi:large repetitive protein
LTAVPAAAGAALRPRKQYAPLEARILFDAAGFAAADLQMDDTAQQQAEAQRVASEQSKLADQYEQSPERFVAAVDAVAKGNTVVVIDSRVANYQELLQGVDPGATVRIIGTNEDGLQVISELLGGTGNVSSLQIVSHGQAGAIRLGRSTLDSVALNSADTAAQLQGWQNGMTADADILILGCDVAQGSKGQSFVQRLADLTQADISASTDDTGGAAKGGNWVLEFNVGTRDSTYAFSERAIQTYSELMAAGPTTTLSLPTSTLIGASNQAGSVTFDNSGTTVGYAPYVAVAFDSNRSPDPSTNIAEGITYVAGSGSFLGTPLADIAVLTFDASGNASTPLVIDPATGAPLVFTAASFGMGAGDTLVIYQLPYGSFTPDNPAAKIDFKYNVGANADASNTVAQGGEGAPPLGIASRGLFLLGETPLAEVGDAVVLQAAATTATTNPIWYRTAYINSSREGEQVPGANDKQYFIAELEMAPGQTVLSNNGVIDPTRPGTTTDRYVSRLSIPSNINFDPAVDVTLNYNPTGTTASPNDPVVTGAQIFVVDKATGIRAGLPGGPLRDPILGTWSSAGGVELVAIAPAGTSFTGGVLGLELNYFIPDTIIDPATGADVPQFFDAKHTGNVKIADGDDPQNAAFTIDPAQIKIEYETIQIQKTVAGATPNALDPANPNGVRSGDVLTYTLTVQVGDFYGIRDAVITDALPDGMEFNPGSMRVVSGNVNGQATNNIAVTPTVFTGTTANTATGVVTVDVQAGEIAESAVVDVDGAAGVQVGGNGKQVLQLNLSNAIAGATAGNAGVTGAQAGDLLGDAFGTAAGQGLTTVTITYTATVRDTYRVPANANNSAPSTGVQVLENDVLRNDVRISGTLLQDTNTSPTVANIVSTGVINADESTASVTVKDGKLDLEVFAINGVLASDSSIPKDAAGRPVISAGDNVTYRLRYNLSQGDFNNLKLEGFLPDPIFQATDPDLDGTPSGYTGVTPTAAGELTTGGSLTSNWAQAGTYLLGPTHNQSDVTLSTPVVTSTATSAGNSVAFNINTSSSRPSNPLNERVDILFTVKASDQPYADNLLLTAQARETAERSVNGGVTEPTPLPDDAITQIVRAEPRLVVSHGVIAKVGSQGGDIQGNTGLGTVPDALTGSATAPFSGTLTSASQINGNVTNVDAGDTLRMGFAIQNTGGSGAFDVKTTAITPPPGYRFVSDNPDATAAANNFQVRRGDGTLLTAGPGPNQYTVTFNAAGEAIVELNDAANTAGLGKGRTSQGTPVTDGSNILVITYDVVADSDPAAPVSAVAADNATSTLAVDSYASRNGGTDFTTAINAATGGQVRDDAFLEIARPQVDIRWQGDSTDIDKTVTADDSNQAHTNLGDLVIGEKGFFDIKVTVPEGVTNGLFADINLPAGLKLDTSYNGGVGYEIVSTAAGTGVNGQGLNGQLGNDFVGTGVNAASAANIAGNGGALGVAGVGARVNLGNITNVADNNAGNNSFIVRVRVVVDNVASNQQGVANTTTSDAVFTDADGATGNGVSEVRDIADATITNDPTMTVVEPTVTTVKTVAIVDIDPAPGDQPGTAADENDIVEYTITLTNTSDVKAWDLSFNDVFPTQLLNDATLNITSVASTGASINGATPSGMTAADFTLNTATRALTLNTANTYDLDVGGTIVVKVRGKVNETAAGLANFGNDAETRWTSLDRSSAAPIDNNTVGNTPSGERGGVDGLLQGTGVDVGTGPTSGTGAANTIQAASNSLNDYRTASRALVPVVTIDPVLSHIGGLADTSANPADTQATQDVAVGEVTRFRMVVKVPAGQINNFSVVPTLPGGYEYLGNATVALVSDSGMTSSVLSGAGLQQGDGTGTGSAAIFGNIQGDLSSATYSATGVDPRDAGTKPVFAITNSGSAAAPAFDLGTLTNGDNDTDSEYVVIEFNAIVKNDIANQSGTSVGPVVFDVKVGAATVATSNVVADTVVEPNISNLAKNIVDIPAGTQSSTTPGTYTVTVQNSFESTGGTSAYDTQFRDTMPGGTNAANVLISLDNGATFTTLAGFANPALGRGGAVTGGVVDVNLGDLALGTKVVIKYDVDVPTTATTQAADNTTHAQVIFSSIPDIAAASLGTAGFAGSSIPGADGAANGERNGTLVAQSALPTNDIAGTTLNNYRNVDPAGYGTIAGTLWDDTQTANGVIDAGESVLAGVTVTLTWGGADGVVGTGGDDRVITTITNASGQYTFGALPQGGYQITVPATTPKTDATAATDPDTLAIRVDADAGTLATINTTVAEATAVVAGTNSITARNFGYVQPNDAPVNQYNGTALAPNALAATIGLNEDASVVFNNANANRLSITDPDGDQGDGILQTTLSVAHGTLTVSGAIGGGLIVANNVTGTVILTGTQAEINAALATLTYAPTTNYNGTDALTIVTNDRGQGGDADGDLLPHEEGPLGTPADRINSPDRLTVTNTINFTIAPVNDAPIATGSATLPTTTEDTANPPGTPIGTLFGGNFNDSTDTVPGGSSANTLAAIAITNNPATPAQGVWQYSPDGTTWTAVPSGLSDTNALILPESYQLRFLPDADYNTNSASAAPALTTRLVDNSAGPVTAVATAQNVSTNGGTTPYSAATVQLNTAVTPVNDAPLFGNTTDTLLGNTTEDTPSTPVSVLTAFPDYTDPKDTGEPNGIDSRVGVVIVGNAANPVTEGTWQYSPDGGASWVNIPASVSDTSAIYLPDNTQLRFNPVTNYNGTPGQLTARLVENDQTSSATQQPDLPTNGTGSSFFDAANTPGTIRTGIDLPGAGGVGGSSRISANTRDVGITIAPVNDAPLFAATTPTQLPAFDEDTISLPATIATAFPGYTDPLDAGTPNGQDNRVGVLLTGNASTPAEGNWQYSPDGGTTWVDVPRNLSNTNAIYLPDNTSIRFNPTANFNGTPGNLKARLVEDDQAGAAADLPDNNTGEGFFSGVNTPTTIRTGINLPADGGVGGTSRISVNEREVGITLTPVNDPPDVTAPTAVLPVGDVPISFTGPNAIMLSDPADFPAGNGPVVTVTITPTGNGRPFISALTPGVTAGPGSPVGSIPAASGTPIVLTGTLADINETLKNLEYRSSPFYNGPDSFTVQINDNANGGPGPLQDIATVQVNNIPLNDRPVVNGPVAPDYQPVLPGDSTPGRTVQDLFGPRFTDPRDAPTSNGADTFAGIAVISTPPASQGTYQYSTDGGATWVNIAPGTTAANAVVLAPDAQLRFVANPSFVGETTPLQSVLIETDQSTPLTGDLQGRTGVPLDTAASGIPVSGTIINLANLEATEAGTTTNGIGRSRFSSLATPMQLGVRIDPPVVPQPQTPPAEVLPLLTPLPAVLDQAAAGANSQFVGAAVRDAQAAAAAQDAASTAQFNSYLGNSGLQPNWLAPDGVPGMDPFASPLPQQDAKAIEPAAPPATPAAPAPADAKAQSVDCARPRVVAKPRPPGQARPAPKFPPGSEAAKRFSDQLKRARARARC